MKRNVVLIAIFIAGASMSREIFQVYCAVCHGTDAKGKGSAPAALKAALPDLTLLTISNGGKFPLMVIQGDVVVICHSAREMPAYGDMSRDIRRDETFVKHCVSLPTGYMASVQQK